MISVGCEFPQRGVTAISINGFAGPQLRPTIPREPLQGDNIVKYPTTKTLESSDLNVIKQNQYRLV